MRKIMRQLCEAMLALLSGTAGGVLGEPRPFTVSDAIGMTMPVPPGSNYLGLHEGEDEYAWSPDIRHVIVYTVRGNVSTGYLEDTLLLFDREEILGHLRNKSGTTAPPGSVLARFENNSRSVTMFPAISNWRWLSGGRQLFFLARGRQTGGVSQIFSYDLQAHELQQRTRHPEDILKFEIADNAAVVVYAVAAAVGKDAQRERRNRSGFAIQGESLDQVIWADQPQMANVATTYFALDLNSNKVRSMRFDRFMMDGWHPSQMQVSPLGRWAVVTSDERTMPAYWAEYPWIARNNKRTNVDAEDGEPGSGNALALFRQIQLIDLTTGESHPLLDAPSSMEGFLPTILAWSADESRLVLQSYRPLKGLAPKERERWRDSLGILEVNLRSGIVTPVSTDAPPFDPFKWSIYYQKDGRNILQPTSLWLGNDNIIVEETVSNETLNEPGSEVPVLLSRLVFDHAYVRQSGRWRSDAAHSHEHTITYAPSPLKLYKIESSNIPPNLEALERTSGRRRIVTDFNPQLDALTLGQVEIMTWKDRFGQEMTAGVQLPPHFQAGTPYPLVIQTYGFSDLQFALGGATTGGYAARVLANHGILVIQLQCGLAPTATHAASAMFSTMCYEDTIDALDAKGLIDRKRVGIAGFSHSGLEVQYATAFIKYPLMAAVVVDASQASPWDYVMKYGQDAWAGYDRSSLSLIGAPLFGDGINLWLERSPTFHLDQIRAPIRFEYHGLRYPPAAWDTFAILKRVHRPVELIEMPRESHTMSTVPGWYASQQGSVDWFTFWLQGAIDPDPSKAEQYRRWAHLQHQQELQIAEETRKAASGATSSGS